MGKHTANTQKTASRTFLQAFIPAVIALGIVLPEIAKILVEDLGAVLPEGWRIWLIGAAGAVASIAAALSKIMALPRVNELLAALGLDNPVPESTEAEAEND